MSTPIAYRKPKSGRLAWLFVLSIGLHVGLAFFAIWAGKHLGRDTHTEELELGLDKTEGVEVQELIVAATPPAPPEPPPPEPPPPPPEPDPEPEPEPPPPDPPMVEPEFVEPTPPPKPTPSPKPKVVSKPSTPPPGAKIGPIAREGVVGGNVPEGKTEGKPGGQKVGTKGWSTPRGPYPPIGLQKRIQGTVRVQIATGASGKVTSASAVGSDPILQSAARTMALSSWSGPPNSARTVNVIYRMP